MLVIKAGGLPNTVGPYLQEMETQFSGDGSGFLALIIDRVSRAVRAEKIYLKHSEDTHALKTSVQKNNSSWVVKATNGNTKLSNSPIRAPPAKYILPQGQSQEDGKIMNRLDKGHENRKVDKFSM